MKLVEILARELEKWPKNVYSFGCDSDGEIRAYDKEGGADERHNRHDFFPKTPVDCSDKASGFGSTCSPVLVTREMWQSERAKLKPGKKADAGGWIRHRGTKQPVADGVKVEIRTRRGDFEVFAADGFAWEAKGGAQIMAYRIHKPAEQPAPEIKVTHIDHEAGVIHAESVSSSCGPVKAEWSELLYDPIAQGPLQWRDRIREIDRTVDALEEERVSLIQRLGGEGFRLIDQVNAKIAEAAQAHEDMSDWRNWKVGDLVEYVGGNDSPYYMSGVRYPVEAISEESFYLDDEDDGHHQWTHSKEFVWHSRPSA